MGAKLTKKEQAAFDAESLRVAALPMPCEGETYDPVRHPSVLLDKAGLGVSYDDVTAPVLVPMGIAVGEENERADAFELDPVDGFACDVETE